MIEIQNLTKRFGPVVAVTGLSLVVQPGEVLGFLGPNGAGKSTTMKVLTGFLSPDEGSVRICGHDIVSDTIAAQKRLGYLPEGAPAYGEMTPRQFLHFIAGVRQLAGAEARAAIGRAIAGAELQGVLDQPIETLSKGFRRRVGLAQAILHDPEVLVLDEPTDGLDPNQKHAVRGLIRGMAKDKTIIISTHLLEEVEAICTRAVIIDQGRIVADATPAALAARSPSGRLDEVFRDLTTRDTAKAGVAA
jgi:ABC-2 type transport system ATP-binding protein